MIPRKASEHIEQSAKQQGLPGEDLSIMVNEYWKSLKEELVNPAHNCIQVIGMGKMKTSWKKLRKIMKEINEDETIGDIARRNKLLPWQKLEETKDAEWERKKLHKEIKEEYKRKKKEDGIEDDIETGMGKP